MNILITLPDNNFRKMALKDKYIKKLEEIGNVIWNNKKEQFTRDELKNYFKFVDICVTGWGSQKITGDMLADSPLKLIGHIGGTVQSIVSEEIFNTEIKVVSSNRAFGRTVAEYNLMLHLIAARKAYEHMNKMKTELNYWVNNEICVDGLHDKIIGIIGYGTISREFIKLLKPFDVDIKVYSSHCSQQEAQDAGFELLSLQELLKVSDYVNVQTSLTQNTRHMLDGEALSLLKNGAVIVNAARGAIMDEAALIKELETGRIFAALDVFEKEPLAPDSPLRLLPNAIVMPHMGGKTYECRENFGRIIVSDIIRFASGKELENLVTREAFLRMTQK